MDKEIDFSNLIEIASSGCWNWIGSKYHDGYGKINRKGKIYQAHRYSYLSIVGEIPAGMCVCHSCDNPSCVNPDHLFLGTRSDNMRDMQNKHRWIPHRTPGRRKLTDEQVAEIQEQIGNVPIRAIAKFYCVSPRTIRHVVQNGYKRNYHPPIQAE